MVSPLPLPSASPRALTDVERATVMILLHSERFVDLPPAEIYATLLDKGIYLCSERTMYRLLDEHQELRERRRQLIHPTYSRPELLATAPNQVWSWDITKLRGPATWTYFYLYVIIDIFSRYTVGWMVADAENAVLARRLISSTCEKQGIDEGQLTLHADNGSAMRSKLVAQLLSDLGVTKTHSRPYVSDDNPYSESQFKTLKYRPDFPDRFHSLQHVREFCSPFFNWYNMEHHHSAIGLMTPHAIHYGLAQGLREAWSQVLLSAYQAHPERFVSKIPQPPTLPDAVWINPPKKLEGSAATIQPGFEASEQETMAQKRNGPDGDNMPIGIL